MSPDKMISSYSNYEKCTNMLVRLSEAESLNPYQPSATRWELQSDNIQAEGLIHI